MNLLVVVLQYTLLELFFIRGSYNGCSFEGLIVTKIAVVSALDFEVFGFDGRFGIRTFDWGLIEFMRRKVQIVTRVARVHRTKISLRSKKIVLAFIVITLN